MKNITPEKRYRRSNFTTTMRRRGISSTECHYRPFNSTSQSSYVLQNPLNLVYRPTAPTYILTLQLTREHRAPKVRPVHIPRNSSELQCGTNDTTHTLSSNHTSRNSVPVDIPAGIAVLAPDSGDDGTKERRIGEDGNGQDEGESDGTPVGKVRAVLLTLTDEVVVAEDDLDDGHGAHDAGEYAGLDGDADAGVSDGLGNGGPSSHGRSHKRTGLIVVRVDDARVGGGEEDEHAWGEENGDHRADGLGDPLLQGWGAEKEAGTEIRSKCGGYVGRAGGDTSCDKVETLCILDGKTLTGGGATKYELRGFRGGSERCGISDGADLDTEEGEYEAENACQDSEADVYLPLEVADDERDDEGYGKTEHPHPIRNLLLRWERVLNKVGRVNTARMACTERDDFAALPRRLVDGSVDLAEYRLEGDPDDLVLDEELGERRAHHDHDTRPQEPITWRGRLLA